MKPWLGVIADDYTGATDLAGMLVRMGVSAVQFLGVPSSDTPVPESQCLVVALKSRSIPAEQAVEQSLAAARWLAGQGVEQVFFKYCSTFDSTAAGNIGPVAEALAAELGTAQAPAATIICPAVPENGRTIYQGNLFVGSAPLSESPMRHHPLTPMTDSSLQRLFAAQASDTPGLVAHAVVRQGSAAIREDLRRLHGEGRLFAVVDAIDADDLAAIGGAITDAPLVTGAAGLAVGMAHARLSTGAPATTPPNPPQGPAAVLSGSCSVATQNQVARYKAHHPSFEIDPHRLAAGDDVVAEALAFAQQSLADIPLIYSSADPQQVKAVQEVLGVERSASLIESAFAAIARGLVALGVRRLIVAGGETSGAVVGGLGTAAIEIGREVDPGVPWTVSVEEPRIGLLLKSGNFGSPDIFTTAISELDD
ncbi:MAG: hypothetical protein JWP30_568 [Homoserinimonas sp.]|jgi:uncharacterized protein YgbK (DUF1537 family)|nr:hypothetical protein [Homoserinimonas sp.]